MMNHQKYWTAKLSDKTLCELVEGFNPSNVLVETLGNGQVTIEDVESNELWELLKQNDSFAVGMLLFRLPGIVVIYYRGGQRYYGDANSVADPYLDEIVITSESNAQPLERLESIGKLQQKIWPVGRGQSIDKGGEIEKASTALAQSTLQRLETLNAKLIEQGISYRERVDQETKTKVDALVEELKTKATSLEEEHSAKMGKLAGQEDALEKRRLSLDDRDNTHARRQIRDKMLDDVKGRIENFGVSPATVQKRRPVRQAMWIFLMVLFTAFVFTLYEVGQYDKVLTAAVQGEQAVAPNLLKAIVGSVVPAVSDQKEVTQASAELISAFASQRWLLWGRLLVISFALGGFFLYYIRWENNWAHRHADAEFNLQQFYIDVNRANWVIESCLEWHKSTAQPIPSELLAGISRDLFISTSSKQEQVIHPADELASALLGSASKVKVKAGESELEFDKPAKIPNSTSTKG